LDERYYVIRRRLARRWRFLDWRGFLSNPAQFRGRSRFRDCPPQLGCRHNFRRDAKFHLLGLCRLVSASRVRIFIQHGQPFVSAA
jgi:hypothetical protein